LASRTPKLSWNLADKWGLAPALLDAVELHHAQSPAELEKTLDPALAGVVNLANTICQHLAIGLRHSDTAISAV